MHGRAALAEPVDVDDRDQVVEAGVAGVLEGLPHRALGQLGVAAEDPDPEVGRLEPLPASAIPTEIGRPWPSEPVATSTQGISGVGWPCRREPNSRKVSSSSSSIAPAAL